jgi:hypothetical protein
MIGGLNNIVKASYEAGQQQLSSPAQVPLLGTTKSSKKK